MCDLIPWGLSETLFKIQRAIGDAEVVTLIHDSTPKWGREFLGVMVSWVDRVGLQHTLPVGFKTLSDDGVVHLNTQELRERLVQVIDSLGISVDFVDGMVSDRHSVNKCLNTKHLKDMFPNCGYLMCSCHMLDGSIALLPTPLVENLYSAWRMSTLSSSFKRLLHEAWISMYSTLFHHS